MQGHDGPRDPPHGCNGPHGSTADGAILVDELNDKFHLCGPAQVDISYLGQGTTKIKIKKYIGNDDYELWVDKGCAYDCLAVSWWSEDWLI